MEGALALPELKYPVQGRTLLSHVLCRSDITRMRKRLRPSGKTGQLIHFGKFADPSNLLT